jgi:outer membrane lipoprotein-sorting protein
MHSRNFYVCFALAATLCLPLRPAQAEDKASVLARLDAAARNFHTATASFQFDSIQTDPIPDTDTLTGITYYDRNAGHFRWGAHVSRHNGRPALKTFLYAGGVLWVSDTGAQSDAKNYSQFGKYESYFALGFGAGGTELEKQWTVRYLGQEKIGEIQTDKLELIARDPQVRKNIPKVTVWMDTERAVSLKLVFDEGDGQSRVCTYTHIEVNQPLPKNAFNFDK